MSSRRLAAVVVWGSLPGIFAGAAAQIGPIDRGVVCVVDGIATYGASGPAVDEDYNYVDAFRPDSDSPVHAPVDPLDGPARPSVETVLDATMSGCRWLRGEELEACFPGTGTVRYEIDGLTVSDTQCASHTFKGTFRLIEQDGEAVTTHGACTGDFHCGHATSEIAIDILRVLPGLSDPGSVDGETNDGRGESAPLSEQCTFELKTGRDGAPLAASRFGLASVHLLDESGSLPAFARACADPEARPASTPFTGVSGSSSLSF